MRLVKCRRSASSLRVEHVGDHAELGRRFEAAEHDDTGPLRVDAEPTKHHPLVHQNQVVRRQAQQAGTSCTLKLLAPQRAETRSPRGSGQALLCARPFAVLATTPPEERAVTDRRTRSGLSFGRSRTAATVITAMFTAASAPRLPSCQGTSPGAAGCRPMTTNLADN